MDDLHVFWATCISYGRFAFFLMDLDPNPIRLWEQSRMSHSPIAHVCDCFVQKMPHGMSEVFHSCIVCVRDDLLDNLPLSRLTQVIVVTNQKICFFSIMQQRGSLLFESIRSRSKLL